MNIYITGHIKPDLDSIVSAVTYAEFLTKLKRYEGAKIVPVIPAKVNKETKYIFEKFGIELPKELDEIQISSDDAFILVDHNEESQRNSNVVAEQVIEIIDHHKINISFTSPIRLDVKPLGSTASLIFEQFEMYGIVPSETSKNLLLASILSDTQGLKASTTTGYDSEIAHKLAKDLSVDLDKFTFELFKAKSDITGLTSKEIVTKDYKIFDFNGIKVLINQIETVEPEKIIAMKDELLAEMHNLKTSEGVAQVYNVITDILKINSHIMYTTSEEQAIVEKAFTTEGRGGIADIGPKMSRKKDINPEIEKVIVS